MAEEYINIGDFDTLITFLREEKRRGDRGQTSKSFEPDGEEYGSVEIDSAEEGEYNENMAAIRRITVVTYPKDITSKWRLKIEDIEYEITSVVPVKNHPFIKISAFQVLDDR